MLRSLTGFGSAYGTFKETNISVDIKSLNHRYLDISFKMPRVFSSWEFDLRNIIQENIKRGKINVLIDVENPGNLYKNLTFDNEILKKYIEILRFISKSYSLSYDLTLKDVFNMKGVFDFKEEEPDEELKNFLKKLLQEAISNLIEMKIKEGKFLENDILKRIKIIENYLKKISELKDKIVENYKKKLKENVEKIFNENKNLVDEKRIEFEIVLFSDKADITEEIVRLKSHIEKFRKTCKEEPPVGKKLDFILQEMHREINTIGAKNNLQEISEIVIEVKNQIERIREQIQNIEWKE